MSSSFVAALSQHPDPIEAAGEVLGDLSERLAGDPDLAVVFASGSHTAVLGDVCESLTALVGVDVVIAQSASGVIGGGQEVEQGPALSAWVGATGPVRPIRLEALGSGHTILGLPDHLEPGSVVVLLVDPFTFPVETLLDALAESAPEVRVVGGLASAARTAGGNTLVLDRMTHRDGAVGVVLPAGVATPLVSQGCRPIGQPWVITAGSGQMVQSLGGENALTRLQTTIESLSSGERGLAAGGLHVGIVANEQTERFEQGDFLIRSLLGGDRSTGALAVGDRIEVGQVVQFHVRDAQSAGADLARQLDGAPRETEGVLLFTCNGRGSNLFTQPHHDAMAVSARFDRVALAGMFCAGELGPVGRRNALHGFTATMLLFGDGQGGQ